MRENKHLAAGSTLVMALAMLVATSVFAESRPEEGTRSGGEARATARRGSVSARGEVGRGNESRNRATVDRRRSPTTPDSREGEPRATTRSRDGQEYERRGAGGDGRSHRSYDRRSSERSDRGGGSRYERRDDARAGRSSGTDRGSDSRRGHSRWNGSSNHRGSSYGHGNRSPYYHHGRISNYHRYGGGYRVWMAGAPYPFYVPLAYWRPDRFRVGLSIGLGGYYNSAGYYDYYDGYRDGVHAGSYYDNGVHSRADFRGVVESVDWRRDTFVVRNEATGSFVTVVLRDRREGDVRPGDFVEVRGDWTTRGVFRAYDVDLLD